MGAIKKNVYSESEIILAQYAKAIAHPARIMIIRLLSMKNACVCGDIVNELPLSQSTVSQHLKELKKAGLVKGDVEGTSICYCLDKAALRKIIDMIGSLAKIPFSDKSCC